MFITQIFVSVPQMLVRFEIFETQVTLIYLLYLLYFVCTVAYLRC